MPRRVCVYPVYPTRCIPGPTHEVKWMELPLNEHHSYFISLPPTNYHRVNASLHRLNFTGPGSLSLLSGGGWGRYRRKWFTSSLLAAHLISLIPQISFTAGSLGTVARSSFWPRRWENGAHSLSLISRRMENVTLTKSLSPILSTVLCLGLAFAGAAHAGTLCSVLSSFYMSPFEY